MYGLYLYFLGLSFRSVSYALDPFVNRSHMAVWQWVQRYEPHLVRKIQWTQEHQKLIVDALTAVVNEAGGTGGLARLRGPMAGIQVAGKTGTAQVAKLGEVRLKKEEMTFERAEGAVLARRSTRASLAIPLATASAVSASHTRS